MVEIKMRYGEFSFSVFVLLAFIASPVFASTQNISIGMTFAAKLSVVKNSDINFGVLSAEQEGTYTISPQGEVTATDSGVVLGGATQAANLTLSGSGSQTVNITADNYVADNGVTPSEATCAYDGGATAVCALDNQPAPDTGKTLLVGVTVEVDGTQQPDTTASPSFDIMVTYN